ncbi:hypothetical protein B566_EDAN003088 [Ephemera danica]|nr:hypothetical protein B566_EDAN003088 [Ephemera danica]
MPNRNTMKFIIIITVIVGVATAIPKPDEKEKKPRTMERDLSDKEHYQNEEHNPDYDHEAFLGEEEAKTFDQLTPEESRNKLAGIVEKIDKDADGQVTQEELKNWIQFTQKRYILDDVDRQWKAHNPENKEKISWEEYKKMVYGFMDGDMYRSTEGEEEPDWVRSEKEQFARFRDKNGDGVMDKEEVKSWIIPPDFDHAEAEARHLIYEADTDKDTKLSKDEILNKYDLFVGSQATDFGEALTRHDEF